MNLRKLLFLFYFVLFCAATGWASIFKVGSRAKVLKTGTYFVYNTCMVYGSTDYTGFYYSNNGQMTVNHGPKPSTFLQTNINSFWSIVVVDEATGKCTMQNSDGYYVDNEGHLTKNETFIYITTYVYGQAGACGNDVNAENEDEKTSALPSTTASENAGLWIIGNEDKSKNWTSRNGTSFNSHSAGQPMALYPVKGTKYTISSVGELSAPTSLTIGSTISFYNVNEQSYVWEGTTDFRETELTKLYTKTTTLATGNTYTNSLPMVFEVGGADGAYTFKNVVTGNYIKALNQSVAAYTGSESEAGTFSLEVVDGNVNIKGANGQYFNRTPGVLVGWYEGGSNSNYKIATVSYEASDLDISIGYRYQWEGSTAYINTDFATSGTTYEYADVATIGITTSPSKPASEVLNESKIVDYNYTNSGVDVPFTLTDISNGNIPSDAHIYKLQLRDEGKYAKYNASDNTTSTSTSNTANTYDCAFIVTGDPVSGYKFLNIKAGAGKFLTVPDGNGSCSFTNNGTAFEFIKSSDGYNLFKAIGKTNCYIHDYANTLGVWYASSAATDVGSSVVFKEIETLDCTVSLTGISEDIDRLIYNSQEYENNATISLPWSQICNISSASISFNNNKQVILSMNEDVLTAKFTMIKQNVPYLIKVKGSEPAIYVDMIRKGLGDYGNNSASLQSIGTPIYFTLDSDGKYFINTQPNGTGNWLGATTWNTNISDGKCSWEIEEADYSGVYGYKFKQNFAQYKGYMGNSNHVVGSSLYDNQSTENDIIIFELEETIPFTPTTIYNGDFAENTKWYNIKIRGDKYSSCELFDKENKNGVNNPKGQTNSMYCFVKDESVENGYKIYNYCVGANAPFYCSSANNSIGHFSQEGTTFILKDNGTSGFVFQVNGEANAHINDVTNSLGVWNSAASRTDGGSTMLFEEVEYGDLEAAKQLPQAGKFYTIQETTTSQYLTPNMSTVNTSRLAMDADASEADRIFYFTGLNLLGYNNGRFLANSNNFLVQANIGDKGATFTFSKQSDGSYTITYDNARTLYGARTGYVDGAGTGQTGDGYKFNITEVTDLPLAVGANDWATFSAPVAVTVPEGATAYYINSNKNDDGTIHLTEIDGAIPANTGVIIKSEGKAGSDITMTVTDDEATSLDDNKLKPIVAATSITAATGDGVYAFATKKATNVTGFMKINGTIPLNGHKCYLDLGGSASAASFLPIFIDDDVTGINGAEITTDKSNSIIYDLQGRKVTGTQKGRMYIQNGKVFIAR